MRGILENALAYGTIHIAARKGFLYFASFKTETRDPVTVKSDRGLPHLFLLLEAAVSGKEELRIEADMEYQYPLNHITSLNCLFERNFRHAYVKIYRVEEEIKVQMQYPDSCIAGMPGLASKEGTGPSIELAMKNIIDAEPKAILAFLSP